MLVAATNLIITTNLSEYYMHRVLSIKEMWAPSIQRQFAPDKSNLESFLKQALTSQEEAAIRAYRVALESKDASAEFIIQYGILAAMYGDQSKIDNQLDPGKKNRVPNARSKYGETAFTRVRNEVAHPKDRKRPLHDSVREAASLRAQIRELVRKHLIKFFRLPS